MSSSTPSFPFRYLVYSVAFYSTGSCNTRRFFVVSELERLRMMMYRVVCCHTGFPATWFCNRHVYSLFRTKASGITCIPSLSTPHLGVLPRSDMTSRINIARPAGRGGYSPDPHGLSNSQPSSSGYRAAKPDDPLEKVRQLGKQIEDNVEIHAQPLKPHLPTIGRFLIVVTFIEDSIRILTQWSDQLWYLQK